MSRTKIAQHFYNLGVQQARLEMLPRRTKTAAISNRALTRALGIGSAGAAGGYGGLALAQNAKSLPYLSPEVALALETSGTRIEDALLSGLSGLGQGGKALLGGIQGAAGGAGSTFMEYLNALRNLG